MLILTSPWPPAWAGGGRRGHDTGEKADSYRQGFKPGNAGRAGVGAFSNLGLSSARQR